MYVVGVTGQDINEYTLSTAWNISTASYVQNFSVASQETSPQGLFFKPDGTKMYITGGGALGPKGVIEYSLSTAWNISTASYVRNFSVSSQDTGPESLFFKPDGTKMYVIGSTSGTVYQYSTAVNTQTLDLSTGNTFSLTPSGAVTLLFTNPPASGVACAFTLEVNNNGSAITWPASVKWHKATTPTSSSTKELYAFITTDGGTKYYGRKAAEELL
jgi:DNA-binding beta-propeller fold protein YncE